MDNGKWKLLCSIIGYIYTSADGLTSPGEAWGRFRVQGLGCGVELLWPYKDCTGNEANKD